MHPLLSTYIGKMFFHFLIFTVLMLMVCFKNRSYNNIDIILREENQSIDWVGAGRGTVVYPNKCEHSLRKDTRTEFTLSSMREFSLIIHLMEKPLEGFRIHEDTLNGKDTSKSKEEVEII